MPWQERSSMSERQEFVAFARQEGANIAALCRHFGISRKTGYKWLARAAQGETTFADRSRRPHSSPWRTTPEREAAVLAKRQEQAAWGGRKLHHALARQGMVQPPAPSTITAILRRHGLLAPEPVPRDFVRFAHAAPNDLWQLDFMGHRALDAGRVHPLSVLDDHSRFALTLTACANEQHTTVKTHLTRVFQHYGLPRILLCDNGSPWAPAGEDGLTRLEAWSNAFMAPSPPRSSARASSPIWPRRRRRSIASAPATTTTGPMKPSPTRCLSSATGPAPGRSPRRCRRSSMGRTMLSAP